MTLNNDSKYLTLAEVLARINDDVTTLGKEYKFASGSALQRIFKYSFDDKWALPEGTPPYTPNKFVEGASPVDLLVMIKRGRLEYFSSVMYPDLSKAKREELFIRTLESVHAKEAAVLLMIKDQEITKNYPNITRDVLVQYGYLALRGEVTPNDSTVKEEVKEETKSTPVSTEVVKEVEPTKKEETTKTTKKRAGRPRKTAKK